MIAVLTPNIACGACNSFVALGMNAGEMYNRQFSDVAHYTFFFFRDDALVLLNCSYKTLERHIAI